MPDSRFSFSLVGLSLKRIPLKNPHYTTIRHTLFICLLLVSHFHYSLQDMPTQPRSSETNDRVCYWWI